jgi:hypothetical protein
MNTAISNSQRCWTKGKIASSLTRLAMTRQSIRMSLRAKRSNLNALDKGPSTDQNEVEKIAIFNEHKNRLWRSSYYPFV